MVLGIESSTQVNELTLVVHERGDERFVLDQVVLSVQGFYLDGDLGVCLNVFG